MKKLILLGLLASCSVQEVDHLLYTVNYDPQVGQYGETYWPSHNLQMLEPIEHPYQFIRCYVDQSRDRDDYPSRRMVEAYDRDTNLVQIYLNERTVSAPAFQGDRATKALECSKEESWFVSE